jgi:hypothetical protein
VLRRGIGSGEFRPVDVDATVYSLVLPMVMLCLHKHSLAACPHAETASGCASRVPALDPQHFIAQHFQLVLRGLLADKASARAAPEKPAAAARRARREAA